MATDTPRNLVWKHIRAIETGMMVTHDGETIHARPMRGIARPEQNTIWFFANSETHTEEELRRNPRVCLTYSDVRDNVFVSVSGAIEIVRDRDALSDLWNEEADAYFEQGADDPKAILLRFTPETGQYWEAPSSTVVIAIRFVEAKILGGKPNLGSSGKADFPASQGTGAASAR